MGMTYEDLSIYGRLRKVINLNLDLKIWPSWNV